MPTRHCTEVEAHAGRWLDQIEGQHRGSITWALGVYLSTSLLTREQGAGGVEVLAVVLVLQLDQQLLRVPGEPPAERQQ